MAQIKILSNLGVSIFGFETGLTNSIVTTSTSWVKTNPTSGDKVTWTGTGFSYDSAGWITAGSATAINFSDSTDSPLYSIKFTTPWNIANHPYPSSIDPILAGDDTLTGAAGNDQLAGGTGINKLMGGGGDDTYQVHSTTDSVIEKAGQGYDTVGSFIANYTLPASVEKLLLLTNAVKGSGNALDNLIYGNDAANTLKGYAGNDFLIGNVGPDTLIGGLGDDSYHIDNVGDVIKETADQGNDVVWSNSISYVLPANVEGLTLYGTVALNGTGNDLANTLKGNDAVNVLKGNAGNDVLDGGVGNDILDGGSGNDTLTGGSGNDVFKLTSKQGVDNIQDFVVADDTIKIENSVFTSLGAAGKLAAGEFISGPGFTAAVDNNDYLIYDNTTGALYYDADANGTGAAQQIALLGAAPALTFADFVVI